MKQAVFKLVYKPRGKKLPVSVKVTTILKLISKNHGLWCGLLNYRDKLRNFCSRT